MERLGRYEIIEKIGEGGMGTVYKAKQPTLNKTVALKVLADFCAKDEELVKRFMREARIMANLPDYRHVVQVFDLDEVDGRYFYTMEYIPLSLAEYIGDCEINTDRTRTVERESKMIPVETAMNITCHILEGLKVIHKAGIIHRDISPQNILLIKHGEDITAKITDFGIAGVRDSGLTKTGMGGIGKEIYGAPEQWESLSKADERSDIYSLGILIYRMVTGRLPVGVGIKEPADLNPEVGKALNDVIIKATAQELEGRFQSAKEMLLDIEGISGGMPDAFSTFTNSIGMKFLLIPPGAFMMGSPPDEPGRYDNEKQHRVTLTRGFYIQTTEVTIGQFRAFVKTTGFKTESETGGGAFIWTDEEWEKKEGYYWDNPGFSQTDSHPVTCVSWNDAQAFIEWLKRKEGKSYRLPTEAEWEYACRAGTTTPFYTGDCISTDEANYDGRYPLEGCPQGVFIGETINVGNFEPNPWSLYDMHGNVYEWCQDWYEDYPSGNVIDPQGPSSAKYRVLRGGCWDGNARGCRSASRTGIDPGNRSNNVGFRVARDY